jgi:hypothetical protein
MSGHTALLASSADALIELCRCIGSPPFYVSWFISGEWDSSDRDVRKQFIAIADLSARCRSSSRRSREYATMYAALVSRLNWRLSRRLAFNAHCPLNSISLAS